VAARLGPDEVLEIMRFIDLTPLSVLMIENIHWRGGQNSGACFQIESSLLFYERRKKPSRASARLCKANDHGLCQKKRLAGVKAELDVSVVENVPFCKTIGDELTGVLHHERFGGISVEKPSNRVRYGLHAATLLARYSLRQSRRAKP
jgi:hypothetical protein